MVFWDNEWYDFYCAYFYYSKKISLNIFLAHTSTYLLNTIFLVYAIWEEYFPTKDAAFRKRLFYFFSERSSAVPSESFPVADIPRPTAVFLSSLLLLFSSRCGIPQCRLCSCSFHCHCFWQNLQTNHYFEWEQAGTAQEVYVQVKRI